MLDERYGGKMAESNKNMKNVEKENKNKNLENKDIKNNEQKILSPKAIIFIVVGVLLLILLILYIGKWKNIKTAEKIMNSYLISNNTTNLEIKNLSDINQVLTEAPNEYFVLISYTGNGNTYDLEKNLKPLIDKYKINDSFYYYDAKKIMKDEDYLQKLNKAFNTNVINTVPIILYYKNGKLIDYVKRVDKNIINAGDFQKLLDIYNFKGQ